MAQLLAGSTAGGIPILTLAGGVLTGSISAPTLISTVANGTAPMTVISTTVVTNFNADKVDGYDVSTTAAANKIPVYNASAQLVGDITGNSASATKLQTARTITLSTDATGSVSFDGTANVTLAVTLANSGVTAGTYRSVTVDAKGRVTGGTNPTTLAGYGITDAALASSFNQGVKTTDAVTFKSLGLGTMFYETQIGTMSSVANVANQKADIIFQPASGAHGSFDIIITGLYPAGTNGAGRVTKTFNFVGSGGIGYQKTRYSEVEGNTAQCISISDMIWDATNSVYKIPVSMVNTTAGGTYTVFIRAYITYPDLNMLKSATLSSTYTTDATVFPTPFVNFNGKITTDFTIVDDGAGNSTARTLSLNVATGTAPMIVNSTTVVTNFNADRVDGYDVSITAVANKIPVYNGSAQLVGDITGNALGNAATATKLQTTRTISTTGDATGSGSFDGTANLAIALTLANSGVTAGTYTKVTVDAKGRVTVGAALVAADIPALDWSKITTGKPTTLAGYGVTDAVANTVTTPLLKITSSSDATKYFSIDYNETEDCLDFIFTTG